MAATVAPAGHICVLRSNGDDGNRIPLDASAAATVTFGRALTSDVRIALAHCSRLHAELRVDQNARVSLVNHAKAANATLLNAQPLAPKAARDGREEGQRRGREAPPTPKPPKPPKAPRVPRVVELTAHEPEELRRQRVADAPADPRTSCRWRRRRS